MATQGLLSHPEGVTRSILRRWPSLTLRVSPSDWHRGVRQLPSRATQQQSQDSNPGSLEPGPKLLIMPDLLLGQHQPTAVSILGCVSWATGCTEQFYLFLKTTLPTFVSILQMRKLRYMQVCHNPMAHSYSESKWDSNYKVPGQNILYLVSNPSSTLKDWKHWTFRNCVNMPMYGLVERVITLFHFPTPNLQACWWRI